MLVSSVVLFVVVVTVVEVVVTVDEVDTTGVVGVEVDVVVASVVVVPSSINTITLEPL